MPVSSDQVTERTRADVQGGILSECDSKLKLIEASQIPAENLAEFNNLKKFNVFNTNNLWVSLKAVQVLPVLCLARVP